jgi:hypothetical protein
MTMIDARKREEKRKQSQAKPQRERERERESPLLFIYYIKRVFQIPSELSLSLSQKAFGLFFTR